MYLCWCWHIIYNDVSPKESSFLKGVEERVKENMNFQWEGAGVKEILQPLMEDGGMW